MDPKTKFHMRVFALLVTRVTPADPRAIYDVDALVDELWLPGLPDDAVSDAYILKLAAKHIHPRSPQKETTVTDNTIKNPSAESSDHGWPSVPQGTDVGVLAGEQGVGIKQPAPIGVVQGDTVLQTGSFVFEGQIGGKSDEDPMVQILRDDLVAGKSRIADNTALIFDVRYPNTRKLHHFVANHHQGTWYLSGVLEGARKVKHAQLLAILSQIGVKGSIRVVTATKVVG